MTRPFLLVALLTGVVLLPTALAWASAVGNSDAKWEERTPVERYGLSVGGIAVLPFIVIFTAISVPLMGAMGGFSSVLAAGLVAGFVAWMFWSLLFYGSWRAFYWFRGATKGLSRDDA